MARIRGVCGPARAAHDVCVPSLGAAKRRAAGPPWHTATGRAGTDKLTEYVPRELTEVKWHFAPVVGAFRAMS